MVQLVFQDVEGMPQFHNVSASVFPVWVRMCHVSHLSKNREHVF